jgi:hypothetical protein
MAAGTKIRILSLSAILLLCTQASQGLVSEALVSKALAQAPPPRPQPGTQVNTLQEVFERLFSCWKPPAASVAAPMDITVLVSFNRSGAIMGRPRITYESPKATDSDRLAYRLAVMEALQRCSPMPFTETMAGAAAGRPLAIQFRTHLQQQEKRAWLSPKIL